MKTQKKLFAFLMLFFVTIFGLQNSFGQSENKKPWRGIVSLDNTFQTTFAFGRTHTTGIGLNFKLENSFNLEKTFFTAEIGFLNYGGSDYRYYNNNTNYNYLKFPELNSKYLLIGLKYYPDNNFYLNAGLGINQISYGNDGYETSVRNNVATTIPIFITDNKYLLQISPGIGYNLKRIDFGLQFNYIVDLDQQYKISRPSIFNNLSFRVGYRFNFKE